MKRHLFTSLLLVMAAVPALGQTAARVFTYDAAGNRTAMGVPVSFALQPGVYVVDVAIVERHVVQNVTTE